MCPNICEGAIPPESDATARGVYPPPGLKSPDAVAGEGGDAAVLTKSILACILVEQEDMPSCSPRRYVLLLNKKICLPVQQEGMPSCSTRRHVFFLNKKMSLLVQHEDMSSC